MQGQAQSSGRIKSRDYFRIKTTATAEFSRDNWPEFCTDERTVFCKSEKEDNQNCQLQIEKQLDCADTLNLKCCVSKSKTLKDFFF